jgi:hypothetical protein
MKQYLPKWIFASVAKHFDDRKQTLPLFIEGMVRQTNKETNWAEFRLDGPYLTEVSRGQWYIEIEVNVLVESATNTQDAYIYLKNVGIMAAAFTKTIKVFRLGDEAGDDGSLVGCLILKQEYREKLVISHFGETHPNEKQRQSQIEGHYEMYLNF